MRAAAAILALAVTTVLACNKDDKPVAPAGPTTVPVTAGKVGADGVRRVPITAGQDGYAPAEIVAQPNEKLILVFTRTAPGECLSKVSVAGGPVVELPMNKPVEVAVTMPASGSLGFACGMDMFRGTILIPAT